MRSICKKISCTGRKRKFQKPLLRANVNPIQCGFRPNGGTPKMSLRCKIGTQRRANPIKDSTCCPDFLCCWLDSRTCNIILIHGFRFAPAFLPSHIANAPEELQQSDILPPKLSSVRPSLVVDSRLSYHSSQHSSSGLSGPRRAGGLSPWRCPTV